MGRLTYERRFDAPADVAWDVISDHAIYAEAAPNLAAVEVVEGEGVGMVRRCVGTDDNEWTERCTDWEEGSAYAVAVDVASSDFHRRLFHRFGGEWAVTDGDDGTVVTMAFEFEPRFGPLGWLLARYFEYRAPGLVEAIFDRWAAEIEARDATGGPDAGAGAPVGIARPMPGRRTLLAPATEGPV